MGFTFQEFAMLEFCLMTVISVLAQKDNPSQEDIEVGNLATQTLIKVKMLEGESNG